MVIFNKKKTIVISAINIRSGGTLTILKSCLSFLNANLTHKYNIVALVHKNSLFDEFKNIKFIEYPNSIKSYLLRCFYEYFGFYKVSKYLKPYLWLSLLDSTPNVCSKIRAVYCHNPSPFYKYNSIFEMFGNIKRALYTILYKYFYKINIKKNKYIIVQQNWIRNEFCNMFGVDKRKIIVAYPNAKEENKTDINEPKELKNNSKTKIFKFFFPSFPRKFKNFEVICNAAKELEKVGKTNIQFILTIDGTENKYSKSIISKYYHLKNIDFIGLKAFEEVRELYKSSDCLIFPSKLETWGLPITEAKSYNLPMIVSDLPYAHETVGEYKRVSFFNPDSSDELIEAINNFVDKNHFDRNEAIKVDEPFTNNWADLFKILLEDKNI